MSSRKSPHFQKICSSPVEDRVSGFPFHCSSVLFSALMIAAFVYYFFSNLYFIAFQAMVVFAEGLEDQSADIRAGACVALSILEVWYCRNYGVHHVMVMLSQIDWFKIHVWSIALETYFYFSLSWWGIRFDFYFFLNRCFSISSYCDVNMSCHFFLKLYAVLYSTVTLSFFW